jgi:tetraacyldisaccharide 4'-kinase
MASKLKIPYWLFLPFGLIHVLIVKIRNILYDSNLFKSQRLPKPVISVGNIQMGGTGKTPLTIEIIKELQKHGYKIGLLSRGYKRIGVGQIIFSDKDEYEHEDIPALIGDEPSLILKYLKHGFLGIDKNRFAVAKNILKKKDVNLFIMDDGFQHRKLHRDLDICLIDTSCWVNHPFLFPYSNLRDTKSSLKRANIIILTKNSDENSKSVRLKSHLQIKYKVPVLSAVMLFDEIYDLKNDRVIDPRDLSGKKVVAICGIADPTNFFNMIEKEGMRISYQKAYPDHYNYQEKDIRFIIEKAERNGTQFILTTEKDSVKLLKYLSSLPRDEFKLYLFKIKIQISDFDLLMKKVNEIIEHC